MADRDSTPSPAGQPSGPISWRAGERARTQRPEYAWQREAQSGDAARHRQRRWRNAIWVLLGIALLVALVYLLRFAPRRTPLVSMAGVSYTYPLPPNAWVYEDLEGIQQLDRNTLTLFGGLDDWQSRERGLERLKQHLRSAANSRRAAAPIILYVDMLGAVTGNGEPCLIPPDASPGSPETWLPLQRVLELLKDLPPQVNKLVILDVVQMRVNWRMGMLLNTFMDRLPSAVAASGIENLTVLSSCGPGEVAWASPQWRTTAFGHFLQIGLAGEADGVLTDSRANGRISVRELHAYLRRHVNAWAMHQRGETQRPILIPHDANDFDVAWVLKHRALIEIEQWTVARSQNRLPGVDRQLARLWQRHEQLTTSQPERIAPIRWRNFEHGLLWLEEANASGNAYRSATRGLVRELEAQASWLERHTAAPVSDWTIGHPLPTLPLAEQWNQEDRSPFDSVRDLLTSVQQTPNADTLHQVLEHWPDVEHTRALTAYHLLRLFQRYDVASKQGKGPLLRRALQTDERADRLCAPHDLRLFYWSRFWSDPGDAARRQAIDCLLAGSADATIAANRYWDQADQHYGRADQIANDVNRVLVTRDRTLAELPYLALWVTDPARQVPPKQRLREVHQMLALCVQVRQLSNETAEHPVLDQGQPIASLEFKGIAQKVDAEFLALKQRYLERCAELEQSTTTDAATIVEMQQVLRTPLIPARQRNNLREHLRQLEERLHLQGVSATETRDTTEVIHEYLSAVIQEWGEHPALAILDLPRASSVVGRADTESSFPPFNNEISTMERWGSQVCQNLSNLRSATARAVQCSVEAKGSEARAGQEHIAARIPLSSADRDIRAAAAIGFVEPTVNVTQYLRQFDLQQLLIWNARRVIDDFLGPAAEGETSYFDRAAIRCLAAAEEVLSQQLSAQEQIGQLRSLLEQRQLLAKNGFTVTATDWLLVDETESAMGQVTIRRDAAIPERVLPLGQAALLMQDQVGRLDGVSRIVDWGKLSPEGEVFEFAIPGDRLTDRGPVLKSLLMLRGHEFSTLALLRVLGGVRVDFAPHKYTKATVTLFGAKRKQASLIFILDCSHSMMTPLRVEAPTAGAPAVTTRMEVAKTALTSLLAQLAHPQDRRVGVRFYGHRVGWNVAQPTEMLPQSDYARPIPSDLMPYEDVESVLPLGRFDTIAASRVTRLLESVQAWGETPLYLAIVQALQEFAGDEPDTEKHIVVITDGMNNQFNPTADATKTLNDVLSARGEQPIRIHTIGFGIPQDEREQAVREFNELAKQTDGSFHEPSNASSLLETLERLLGFGEYRLMDATNNLVGETQVDLPIAAKFPLQVEPYRVRWHSLEEKVVLEGGESLQLEIDASGQNIFSLPYEKGSPDFVPLTRGVPPELVGIHVGIHRPVLAVNTVRFPVSFQRADRHFCARPVESWIEVTPRSKTELREYHPYFFYDANYEPDVHVPLLQWRADRWPSQAEEAVIRIWCKPVRTSPTSRVFVNDVADRTPATGLGHPLPDFPGVTFQVRTRRPERRGESYRVSVVERHDKDSPGVGSLRVEMLPHPERITHQFDLDNRISLHHFCFPMVDGLPPQDPEILFTSREAVHSGAWSVNEPIVVNIATVRDVIPLTPAAVPTSKPKPAR